MLRRTLLGVALALAAAPAAHASQTLKLDLASAANATPAGVAVASAPLAKRTRYVVTISGTGTLWTPDSTAPVTCGAPEAGATITEPTPGRTVTPPTVDAAVVYAAPKGVPFLGSFACVPPKPSTPPAQAALRMGTGGALTAATPIGGQPSAPAADHTYNYAVTGRGLPLQLQYADPLVYDNNGILTVTIRTLAECKSVKCLPAKTKKPRPGRGSSTYGLVTPLPCVFRALPAQGARPAATDLCA